ncbi:hypothetical protein [Amphibacillus marinus]|uniref:hypothetical protein n=1 Tax=Amphibacillus marinus TaxID=872970 RepID=UPI000B87ACE3|nr:hypothetical protein [Amphibacillus marinus]
MIEGVILFLHFAAWLGLLWNIILSLWHALIHNCYTYLTNRECLITVVVYGLLLNELVKPQYQIIGVVTSVMLVIYLITYFKGKRH